MIDLKQLQKKIDTIFVAQHIVKKASKGSNGFYIKTNDVITKYFIVWLELETNSKLKNIQADEEHGYVKAFFKYENEEIVN